MTASVTMYTTPWCPYCIRARSLFDQIGVEYSDIDVSADANLRADMQQRSGRHTVPQIWIGEAHVGGFDDVYALARQGELELLLNRA